MGLLGAIVRFDNVQLSVCDGLALGLISEPSSSDVGGMGT